MCHRIGLVALVDVLVSYVEFSFLIMNCLKISYLQINYCSPSCYDFDNACSIKYKHKNEVPNIFSNFINGTSLIQVLDCCLFQCQTIAVPVRTIKSLALRGAFRHCLGSWWRHQMEKFPRYWPFMRGIHRSPVNSPHKGQWRGALMFSLICVW